MSPIAARLSQRALRPRPGALTGGVTVDQGSVAVRTLADLRRGESARIVGYDGDPRTCRRLFDLGLTPGADIKMVRAAPLQDPVIFRVADYELALRRTEARGIHVEQPVS